MAWDVGVFGGDRYFTYVAAFGAFTDVSYETPQQSKQALGHLAYLLEGMNRLPKLPHYRTRVEMDGEVVEGDYIFGGVTNSILRRRALVKRTRTWSRLTMANLRSRW